jgi:hypothetical protein
VPLPANRFFLSIACCVIDANAFASGNVVVVVVVRAALSFLQRTNSLNSFALLFKGFVV